jgi:transcriptional regulator with XRE-family HTH domain
MKANSKSGMRRIALTVGARVRFERQQHGWTQNELADASGVSIDHIAAIETDQSQSIGHVALIAAALGVSVFSLASAEQSDPTVTKRGVG